MEDDTPIVLSGGGEGEGEMCWMARTVYQSVTCLVGAAEEGN
jgi:hypothetical protein